MQADGIDNFYRHAGPTAPNTPTILLLHGYPSSSHMFRNLIPLLASKYRVIAPDLPSYGFTTVPPERNYTYTFANLTTTLEAFVDALGLKRFAIYIFDNGAPTGLRLALRRPGAIAAIATQNGNAYAEGLGKDFWAPLRKAWASGSQGGHPGHRHGRDAQRRGREVAVHGRLARPGGRAARGVHARPGAARGRGACGQAAPAGPVSRLSQVLSRVGGAGAGGLG